MDRRSFLSLLAWPVLGARLQERATTVQGMSSRGAPPSPRKKPSGIPFHARFTDVADRAGLKEPVVSGHSNHADYIIESMSGGAAFFDYDNDGWLDILILSGSRQEDPPPTATNRLYKNNRDGTFSDVTKKAGLFRTGFAYGVTVGDFNNDGFEDLFITYWGQNALYRNNGDGTFTDVTKEAGLFSAEPRFGTGCAFLDYDRDGRLDLFVSNYVKFDLAVPRPGQPGSCHYGGIPVYCGPRGLPYGRHSLYHNNGDGTFTDVTVPSGIGKVEGGYGLTVVSADFDNDGWPDIYVACDSTPSLLFRNKQDGTFSEEGLERGVALSNDGLEQAGMGVAVGDFTLDGCLDIIKTHFSEDTLGVYLNDGHGTFWDVTRTSGLAVETCYVEWGVGLVDLDNDGNPDIFAVTGGVYPELRTGYKTPRALFRNLGKGQFEQLLDLGPGVNAPHTSRGCAFGDFDNDGDVDILIVNQNEPPSLLRNDVTGGHHWIKIKLIGTKSNRSAIGARVIARYGNKVQAQEVLSQSSYISVNDTRLHFGLGAATTVDLEVRWPSGQKEKLGAVPADQLVSVTEGSGITATRKLAGAIMLVFLPLLFFASPLFAQQATSLEQAWGLLAKGQRSGAVHLLYDIIKANPQDADARLLLGSVLMEAGERSQSLAQLTEAVRLRPKSAQAQNALGEALNTFGDLDRGLKAFEKAAELDPHYAPAQVNLGLVLIKLSQFSRASPYLDRAIQLLGHSADAAYPHYLRAKIYSEERQIEKAAAELEEAVSLRPDFAEAWSDLGSARKILLDASGALAVFETAVRFAPNDPIAQERLGSELLSQGKAREALPHLEEAVRLDAHNQTALYNLQRALLIEGHMQEASEVKMKLTALLREKDEADQRAVMAIQLSNEGAALEKAGKLREAFEKYQAASELDPDHTGIR